MLLTQPLMIGDIVVTIIVVVVIIIVVIVVVVVVIVIIIIIMIIITVLLSLCYRCTLQQTKHRQNLCFCSPVQIKRPCLPQFLKFLTYSIVRLILTLNSAL
jgi:hypothetical protein